MVATNTTVIVVVVPQRSTRRYKGFTAIQQGTSDQHKKLDLVKFDNNRRKFSNLVELLSIHDSGHISSLPRVDIVVVTSKCHASEIVAFRALNPILMPPTKSACFLIKCIGRSKAVCKIIYSDREITT
jgi:hypothetical protein